MKRNADIGLLYETVKIDSPSDSTADLPFMAATGT
jgi:hypothetical protein